MKNNIIVSNDMFEKYIKKQGNNKLHRFAELNKKGSIPYDLKINEIFDGDYQKKINNPVKYKSKIIGEFNYEFNFKTKNDNEYRLDFVKLEEIQPNEIKKQELNKIENEIKKNSDNPCFYKQYIHDERLIDKVFISVSFSIIDATEIDYDIKTKRNESIDVLENVMHIVKYFMKNNNEYIYMFGDPNDNEKIKVYNLIIQKCFSDYEIICDYTSGFKNTNIGYYLIK
ncbi:hypothetical protein M0Q50_03750 [bacterium]|jgi:hypothetical protein|nr:hypothetical protein [bacterium]